MSYNLARIINNSQYDEEDITDSVLKVRDIETKEYLSVNDELDKIQHIQKSATTTIIGSILDMTNHNIVNCPSLSVNDSIKSCKIWSECTTYSFVLKFQNLMVQNVDLYAWFNGIGNINDYLSEVDIIYQYWMTYPLQRLKPLSLYNNMIGISHDIIPSNRYVNYRLRCGLKTLFRTTSNQGDFFISVWISAKIRCSDSSEYEDKICLTPFTLKRITTADDFVLSFNRTITYKKHILNSYPSSIINIEFTVKYRLQPQTTYTDANAVLIGNDESKNYLYIDQQDLEDDSLSDVVLGDDNVFGSL